MNYKIKRNELGITLIALIITIIVLVILAAVTLNSIFGNNIIGIAINGAMDYAEEQQKELGQLNAVTDILADFLGDSNKPMAPSVTLDGTNGENGYYTTDVGVTISAGETANVASIKYKVEGANPIAETESTGSNDVTFNITADGTSTVTAYIINTAGLTSETITETVNKDSTAPSAATIATLGEAGETTIDVTASGADATSGVASYIFQISTTGNEDDFTTQNTVNSENTSCTYQYTGLNSNTTYYLRGIIKDKAGNMLPSSTVNTTTKKSGLSEEVLASNIGAYVDYTPDTGTFSDHVGETYNEYNYESTYYQIRNIEETTIKDLKWKVLFVDENKLTLISEKTANSYFGLGGAKGYNNGVLLLNNACKEMYSNSSLGATGRSLKIEDIERISKYDKNSYKDYGEEKIERWTSIPLFPDIFKYENTGAPEGKYGTRYDLSEQVEYLTTSDSYASTLVGICTCYSYVIDIKYMEQKYLDTLNIENELNYWIATRCMKYDDIFNFELFCINTNQINTITLYTSGGGPRHESLDIRPIVEIDLTKVNVGLTGTGAENDGYSLTLK